MVLVNPVFKDLCTPFKVVTVRRTNRYEHINYCYKHLENGDTKCLKFTEYLQGEQRPPTSLGRELAI